MWEDSHHSLVLKWSFSCSKARRQSMLVSTIPKITNFQSLRPLCIISSFKELFLEEKPPMFWKPILKELAALREIDEPKPSVKLESASRTMVRSPGEVVRAPTLGDIFVLGTRASNAMIGAAGILRLRQGVNLNRRGRRLSTHSCLAWQAKVSWL